MHATLSHAFSWVCGQDPAHTWTCDGLVLPCCQRCTGLYLGALAAFILQSLLRPSMNRNFLWVHGMFLMLMVPFGFHWLPQGPLLRSWTGVLFGFAVVTFLRLPLVRETGCLEIAGSRTKRAARYWAGLAAMLAGLAALDFEAARISGPLVAVLLACGALVLWTLAAANVWVGARWLSGHIRPTIERAGV